jgi:hypothetical protein
VKTEEGPGLAVAWEEAVARLAAFGWARAPRAFDENLAAQFGQDDDRQWHVAGDEGVVRQHVIGSYTPFAQAPATVRAIGDDLVTHLSAAAGRQGLPPVPRFN